MTLPETTSTNREYSLRCSVTQNGGDFSGLTSDAITIVPTEGGGENVRIEFLKISLWRNKFYSCQKWHLGSDFCRDCARRDLRAHLRHFRGPRGVPLLHGTTHRMRHRRRQEEQEAGCRRGRQKEGGGRKEVERHQVSGDINLPTSVSLDALPYETIIINSISSLKGITRAELTSALQVLPSVRFYKDDRLSLSSDL